MNDAELFADLQDRKDAAAKCAKEQAALQREHNELVGRRPPEPEGLSDVGVV
jgi:hypothetical protein